MRKPRPRYRETGRAGRVAAHANTPVYGLGDPECRLRLDRRSASRTSTEAAWLSPPGNARAASVFHVADSSALPALDSAWMEACLMER